MTAENDIYLLQLYSIFNCCFLAKVTSRVTGRRVKVGARIACLFDAKGRRPFSEMITIWIW